MARNTQLLITVPAYFNEKLARYMVTLAEKGVRISKAELIIQLAVVGYKEAIGEIKVDEAMEDED